jgi:hypothetical protein
MCLYCHNFIKENLCCYNTKDDTVDGWQHISVTKLMKRTSSATEGTVCKVMKFLVVSVEV